MEQYRNSNNAMETRDHSKNGASLKSQTSKRNKYSVVFFVYLFFFATFSTYAQESKLRVAVIDLYSARDYYVSYAKEVTSILTTELVNTNKFKVAERSRLEQVIKELGLQSTQDVSVRAAEIGKLLGVHKILTGEFTSEIGTTSIRLVDVESGDIEKAVTIDNCIRDKKGKIKRWFSNREIAQKLLVEILK